MPKCKYFILCKLKLCLEGEIKNKNMSNNEKWIEDLKTQILVDDDKVLFEEASQCFLNGQLRAAYIMTWISLIESLKRKIFLLSNLEDSRAITALQKIEDLEKHKKPVDKVIFEESKLCGIIDDSDYSKVEFLWGQRCLFAHPYNLNPEVDEVKHIIGQAARITLCKELHFNKVYLDDLVENISSKPFFLPSEIELVRTYAIKTISRTPIILHPYLFKKLFFKVSELSQIEEKFLELRKLRYYLIELLINTTIPLVNDVWSLENRVTRFPYECFIGFVHQDTWELLPYRIKEMLIAYLEGELNRIKLIPLMEITRNLVRNKTLDEDFQNRYYNKLNGLPFDTSINYYGDEKVIFQRICEDLESGQYEQQNPVVDFLRKSTTIELVSELSKSQQIHLGRLFMSTYKNNNWKGQSLVNSIINGSLSYNEWIKAGIALGGYLLANKDEIQLDQKYIEKSSEILNNLSELVQNEIYDTIEQMIADGKVLSTYKFNETKFNSILLNTEEKITEWNINNKLRFNVVTENIRIFLRTEE